MEGFRAVHADGPDAGSAVRALLERLGERTDVPGPGSGAEIETPTLGIVYATDPMAPHMPEVLAVLREATGVQEWVGAIGIGIIANDHADAAANAGTAAEYHGRAALAVMLASLPAETFRIFAPIGRDLDGFKSELGGWVRTRFPGFGVIHADPANPYSLDIVGELAEETGSFLVGGMTAAPSLAPEDERMAEVDPDAVEDEGDLELSEAEEAIARVLETFGGDQVARQVTGGGVSGILFSGMLEVATGLTQGCSPVGPAHRITECADNVLMELDGRPALEVFVEDIGPEFADDLRKVSGRIFAAKPVEGERADDYLVRNLVAIDPQRGWIAIAAEVEEDDRVLFCRRDGESALVDMRRMLEDLKARAGKTPRAGLYHSCIARGPNLFPTDQSEIALIREVLGDFPLIGFFGNGEISQGRIYGHTGVLTLFL